MSGEIPDEQVSRPAAVRRISVIVNVAAGRGRGAQQLPGLEAALARACEAAGAAFSIIPTAAPDDGERLAREAAEGGADLVVAAGGDGTVCEVENGLAGSAARMGIVPLGTGNDLARHLRLPGTIDEAVGVLFRGSPTPIDVGVMNGRRFTNVAGCGFDAQVAACMNRDRLFKGTMAYIVATVRTLASFRAAALRLTVDDTCVETRAMMCAFANSSTYGGGMRVAPQASVCDGLLDICVVKEVGRIEFLRAFPRVFKGTHITHPKVTMLLGSRVLIESDRPLPMLVDGEVLGTTPAEITVEPGALTVMVPTGSIV